jgi:hypothetical protein
MTMGRRGEPGGSFADRVMARVAQEPTPSPGRVFARSLRRLALRDALAALASAWRLAFEPTSAVATSARASAAAFFLGVVLVVGLGSAFAAGGALAFLGSDDPATQHLAPGASPVETPAAVIEPSLTPQPSLTPAPSLTPEPTPGPSQVARPSANEQEKASGSDRQKRETPEPKERESDKKKRETPEPKEREREDDKDDD